MKPRAVWFWPSLVFIIIGLDLLGIGSLAYFARTDASFAVEKDYYAKAVRWDESRAALARSDALGWSAGVELAPPAHDGDVVVRLIDRDGAPLTGALVTLSAFHRAFVSEILEFTMTEASDAEGVYTAPFVPTRDGRWIIRVSAVRGADEFTAEFERAVGEPKDAAR